MKLIRSAKIVVLDADGRALLLHRSSTHPHNPGAPDLPGGVIKENETIEAGVLRELREETGIAIATGDMTLLYSLTVDSIPGVSVNRLTYMTQLSASTPDIALSYEHDDCSWVPVVELTGLESPYQQGINYATKHNLWREV